MNMSITIAVEGPWFFSPGDEQGFYSWLNSIPSVVAVGGIGTIIEITLGSKRIPQRDLREILAIFHRYSMDKRVLRQLDSPRSPWFRDRKAYWYADVFGRAQGSAKRR